jgi:hypothetical protein
MSTYTLHFAKITDSTWTETLYDQDNNIIEQHENKHAGVPTQEHLQSWADQWCLRRDVDKITNNFNYTLDRKFNKLILVTSTELSEAERFRIKQETIKNGNT